MAPRQTSIGYAKRRGGRAGGKAKLDLQAERGKKEQLAPATPSAPKPPPQSAAPTVKSPVATQRVAVDPFVKAVYKVITKKTELDWGLTSDWKVEGPRKRAQRAAADEELVSPRRETPQPEASSKHGASEGYGEMTEGSIQRMLNTLKEIELAKIVNPVEPPIKLTKAHRLSKNSTFIDVGSGYGKVVLHAAADLPLKASVGIEMVESRHRLAAQVLQDLIAGRCKGIAAQKAQCLRVCSLKCGDATAERSLDFSHIYMYDYVFNAVTLKEIAQLLNKSEWCMLVSYRDPAEWRRHGLQGFQARARQKVDQLCMNTTGGQKFTAHVYANVAARQ